MAKKSTASGTSRSSSGGWGVAQVLHWLVIWPIGRMAGALGWLVKWPTDPNSRLFSWNFVTLILVGVAFSGWLLYFTDSFEVFGGLLALGGLLSWLAFVSKVIPEDKAKEIQKGLFGFFLEGRYAWAVYLGILVAGALATAMVGAIQLETVQTGTDYQFVVYPANGKRPPEEKRERVPAAGHVRTLCFLPWWKARTFKVHVTGFPERQVCVRPWWDREKRQVPSSFVQPVVLLGAVEPILDRIWKHDKGYYYHLVVVLDGKKFSLEKEYEGQAIWLGCGEGDGLELPQAARDYWKNELTRSDKSDKAPLLLFPRELSSLLPQKEREACRKQGSNLHNQQIQLFLYRTGEKGPHRVSPAYRIRQPHGPAEMVQPVLLTDDKVPPTLKLPP